MGVYSIKEISLMVDMPEDTLRTYLGHYSFDKYYISDLQWFNSEKSYRRGIL